MAKATGTGPAAFGPNTANKLYDMLATHEQQKRLGGGTRPKPSPINQNLIKVRNNSGADLARGSVVDISTNLLTSLTKYDPHHLWFSGVEPDGGHYAVLREAAKQTKIVNAQVTGVCIARVDVTDEDHTFAVPTEGETYFTSATEGEIQILDKVSSGTGIKECVVVLRCPSASEAGETGIAYLTASSIAGVSDEDYPSGDLSGDTVYDQGSIVLAKINSSGKIEATTDPETTIQAYNMSVHDLTYVAQKFLVYYWLDPNGDYCFLPLRSRLDTVNDTAGIGFPPIVANQGGIGSIVGTTAYGSASFAFADPSGIFATVGSSPAYVQVRRSCEVLATVRALVQDLDPISNPGFWIRGEIQVSYDGGTGWSTVVGTATQAFFAPRAGAPDTSQTMEFSGFVPAGIKTDYPRIRVAFTTQGTLTIASCSLELRVLTP